MYATLGRLKNSNDWIIQALAFAKRSENSNRLFWPLSRAKAWVKKNPQKCKR